MRQTVKQAEAALAAADKAYTDELERDAERGEGSGSQDISREGRLRELRSTYEQCKRDLEAARRGDH